MIENSQFRLISIGIVAENKSPDSRFIEVYPIELFPLIEGGITAEMFKVKREGVTLNKEPYNLTLHRSLTVKADWIGSDHRLSSPHVRAGEQVKLWTIGNSEKYYWEVLGRDLNLRTVERVTWAFAARETGDKPLDSSDSYYFTIDTIDKHITLETSKANGEVCRYLCQINTGDGNFTFQDDIGNTIHLDSTKNRFVITNADGTFFVLDKEDMYLEAPGNFSKKIAGDCTIKVGGDYKATIEGTSIENVTGEKGISAKRVVMDVENNVEINATQAIIIADVQIDGDTTMNGNLTVEGTADITGLLTATGGISTPTIIGLTSINGDPITDYKNPSP